MLYCFTKLGGRPPILDTPVSATGHLAQSTSYPKSPMCIDNKHKECNYSSLPSIHLKSINIKKNLENGKRMHSSKPELHSNDNFYGVPIWLTKRRKATIQTKVLFSSPYSYSILRLEKSDRIRLGKAKNTLKRKNIKPIPHQIRPKTRKIGSYQIKKTKPHTCTNWLQIQWSNTTF